MKIFGFNIFREKPGVISESECWVCVYGCWLHTGDSLISVLWNVVTEFKNDRHLFG